MEGVESPRGGYTVKVGPHLLQSISVGEAKVSVVSTGTAPRRGV